jgi:CubicO group peptidase (beta-lactamase class C family)
MRTGSMHDAACSRALCAAVFVTVLVSTAGAAVPLPPQPAGVPYPTEAWPVAAPGPDIDVARLDAALDAAFEPRGWNGLPDTRALLVVHRGAVVAERYAPGFGPDSRMQSWSMAKTVTQALVGILVGQKRLDLHAPAPVPEWHANDDPRGAITLDQLLHMSSGLDNADGGTGPDSFVSRLLFGPGSLDVFAYASNVASISAPDTHWAYSTGTSMIVAGIVGRTVGGGPTEMLAFMRRELFDPIGVRTAVPEFDAAGTFLGGAWMWATARDWGRIGYLYLRDGMWDGDRVLPEGWVDYSRTPAPAPNNGVYGAHLWLNREPKADQLAPIPGGPHSAFCLWGNGGQMVVVVPTRDLVIVRLGVTQTMTFRAVTQAMAAVVATVAPVAPSSPED